MAWVKEYLGNRLKVISGYAFKSSDFLDIKENNIPVVKIKNIKNGYVDIENDTQYVSNEKLNIDDKFKVFNGDILISLTGSQITQPNSVVGRIAKCYFNDNQIALLNQRAGKFIINEEKLNKDFLFYLLSNDIYKQKLALMGHGAASQANISPSQVESLEVYLPDKVEEQQKIAKILSNYDDLIENNNKRIKILEEMAQKIYKEWFVGFKFPNHETATFKQTDLGKIPTDWEINKLSDFGETITGKTPSKNDDSNYGKEVDFIKTPDMHNGIFCLDTVEHLSLKGANTQKNKFIPIGSICVSCIGTVGVVAITTKNSQTNQQINSIIPKNSFYREYLYFVCNNLKPTLENLGANGATMTNVNKNKFDNIQVSKPSDKLLQAFSQLIKPIFEQIKNLSLKNQTLKQTRDLLLPRLISDEIDVENMEIV